MYIPEKLRKLGVRELTKEEEKKYYKLDPEYTTEAELEAERERNESAKAK